MASEQTAGHKKHSRITTKEEYHQPILYRHQDCIPSAKLLQNCEKNNLIGIHHRDLDSRVKFEPNLNRPKLRITPTQTVDSPIPNKTKPEKVQLTTKLTTEKVIDAAKNNEEFSKSRKRRLRKQKLLESLAPAAPPTTKPSAPANNIPQTNPVSHPPSSSVATATNRSSNLIKTPPKESRKRPDKSGSRTKTVKSKTLAETTSQAKINVIKAFDEKKTLNSLLQTLVPLTNSSPKKEKPAAPLFTFPEKRLSDTRTDKDGVFYFGETKHQLEKLSTGLSNYSNSFIHDQTQSTESYKSCFSIGGQTNDNFVPSFNFSSLGNGNLNSNVALKQNYCETVSPPRREERKTDFLPEGPCHKKDQIFKTPTSIDPIQLPIQLHNLTKPISNPVLLNISTKSLTNRNNISDHISNQIEGISVLSKNLLTHEIKQNSSTMKPVEETNKSNKTREEILLERETKKAAKLAAKAKPKSNQPKQSNVDIAKKDNESKLEVINTTENNNKDTTVINSDSRTNQIIVDSKCQIKNNVPVSDNISTVAINKGNVDVSKNNELSLPKESSLDPSMKSKAELRAERRAKQEAQRAAKASNKTVVNETIVKIVPKVKIEQPSINTSAVQSEKKQDVLKVSAHPKPKLFSHLYQEKPTLTSHQLSKAGSLHPAIVRLGVQYAERVIVGSNARCVALLHALKQMVNDYTNPSEKDFSRGLEEELGPVTSYLHQCRPMAVSMTNALRHLKRTLTQLPNNIPDDKAKQRICEVVDTYIHEQIDTASRGICERVQQKILTGDVIVTYGCSSLVYQILVESHLSGTKFRVVVVDGSPWHEGREMLRRLVDKGLSCSYVLISAASFIMRKASKVLLGAHALLANGYVMSRAGSSQVALLAHCYNVPVLVCCETHKFSERVQTDAFVYNELGELSPDNTKDRDRVRAGAVSCLTPLSLAYDVTPPDLVSAVVTERAVLPCTSVPVILRINTSESVM